MHSTLKTRGPEEWKPNTSSCDLCRIPFGYLWNRPHHCRLCGCCICYTCSPSNFTDNNGVSCRVCKVCREEKCKQLQFDQSFEQELNVILKYCISGVPYLSQSCKERCSRYLREHNDDIKSAIKSAISRNHSFYAKFTRAAIGSIPIIGIPPALFMPLWRQLREISLIAALTGYDVDSKEVQSKIIRCLALDSSLITLSIPSTTTTVATCTLTTQIYPIVRNQIVEHAAQAGATVVKTFSEKASLDGISGIGYLFSKTLVQYLGKKVSENTVQVASVGSVAFSGAVTGIIGIPMALLLDYLLDNSMTIFDFAAKVFSHLD